MVTITPEEYEAMKDRLEGKKSAKEVKNKYRAKKTDYRGHTYDSKKEADYAKGLDLAMQSGSELAPISWERQIKLNVRINDKHICYYVVDFIVTYSDRVEYIDVKGYKKGCAYQMFRLKKKMVEAFHGIEIIEV
ncbi:MAG: DUF1064 domain-containing protein [Promethearchaeota archaeon]|jgi:hypothetical protein